MVVPVSDNQLRVLIEVTTVQYKRYLDYHTHPRSSLKVYGGGRSLRRAPCEKPDQGTARVLTRAGQRRGEVAPDTCQHSTSQTLDDRRTSCQRHRSCCVGLMDASSSHLSLIIDLSPSQWHLSAQSTNPLSFQTFLSHVLTFLNSHIAAKHENTLAVFGALPGKRCALSYNVVDAPVTDL